MARTPSRNRVGMTLAEVAAALGVTRGRVSQIESAALAKLRHRAMALGLDGAAWAAPPGQEGEPRRSHGESSSAEGTSVAHWRGESRWDETALEAMRAEEAEADAWAARVLELRAEGVPMREAWSLASDCEPPDERRRAMGKSNGVTQRTSNEAEKAKAPPPGPTPSPPAAQLPSGETASLISALEGSRAALLARRESLLTELAALDEALGSRPRRVSARARPEGMATRVARVLEHLRTHPESTSTAIASALGEPPSGVATSLCILRKRGEACSTGAAPALMWSAK